MIIFQDAQLLHLKTVFAVAETRSQSLIKTILSGLFKFRIELFQFMDKICFMEGMTPVLKLLIKAVVVPYVILLFGAMYMVYKWVMILKGGRKSPSAVHREEEDDPDAPPKRTFSIRLSQGFVLCLLFTYQKLASTSFTLLNCVPVGDESVLFVEGTVTCYQMWQYGVMAYTVTCIVPFCLTLLIGPGLLKDGLISLPHFFIGCIIPLPFFLYWLVIRLTKRSVRSSNTTVELTSEAQAVIAILQGPFKETETKFLGPTCGQGVLIGRRLVLVVIGTFVTDPLIRMLLMMLVCFIILLHHVHVLPYKDTKGNGGGVHVRGRPAGRRRHQPGPRRLRGGRVRAPGTKPNPHEGIPRGGEHTHALVPLGYHVNSVCCSVFQTLFALFEVGSHVRWTTHIRKPQHRSHRLVAVKRLLCINILKT